MKTRLGTSSLSRKGVQLFFLIPLFWSASWVFFRAVIWGRVASLNYCDRFFFYYFSTKYVGILYLFTVRTKIKYRWWRGGRLSCKPKRNKNWEAVFSYLPLWEQVPYDVLLIHPLDDRVCQVRSSLVEYPVELVIYPQGPLLFIQEWYNWHFNWPLQIPWLIVQGLWRFSGDLGLAGDILLLCRLHCTQGVL